MEPFSEPSMNSNRSSRVHLTGQIWSMSIDEEMNHTTPGWGLSTHNGL